MSYINGKDVFPQELLEQIYNYCESGLIYIPPNDTRKKTWGETTGIKECLRLRNDEIRKKKSLGYTIVQLTEEYHLSYDSIKRILYRKDKKSSL